MYSIYGRDKLTAYISLLVKLRFRLGWNSALENGADLRVNERQKIRHYRARSTEERRRRRRQNSDFLLSAAVRKIALYSDLIHSFDWKSAVEISRRTRWWCLKCVIVLCQWNIQLIPTYRVYHSMIPCTVNDPLVIVLPVTGKAISLLLLTVQV